MIHKKNRCLYDYHFVVILVQHFVESYIKVILSYEIRKQGGNFILYLYIQTFLQVPSWRTVKLTVFLFASVYCWRVRRPPNLLGQGNHQGTHSIFHAVNLSSSHNYIVTMVLILDGNSEHETKKVYRRKKSMVTTLDLIRCIKQG